MPMSALHFVTVSVLGLGLMACAPDADPQQTEGAETLVETETPADATSAETPVEESLEPLVIAARDACAAGDEGFVAHLPESAGFVSRGPDARVHAAWRLDGEDREHIIATPELEMEPRTAFDFAAADFMRHNMVAGFDRAGITGAFRYRDGRFCVVQTERQTVEALRDATITALESL